MKHAFVYENPKASRLEISNLCACYLCIVHTRFSSYSYSIQTTLATHREYGPVLLFDG